MEHGGKATGIETSLKTGITEASQRSRSLRPAFPSVKLNVLLCAPSVEPFLRDWQPPTKR
jgi:hypothetical protein